MVPLPQNVWPALEAITTGLVTHCRRGHFDHLDKAGWQFFAKKQVHVYCNHLDKSYLQQRDIIPLALQPNQPYEFLGGRITAFETVHGYGLLGKMMGPGMGYLIELPDQPSLYISGDTVLTSIVRQVLTDMRPDVAVLAAGCASFDVGQPILMPIPEILEFIQIAPKKVIATHMEALNHCPMTRYQLQEAITLAGLAHKVWIPNDGEVLAM